MSFIGNLIWFVLGGFLLGLGWIIAGILWICISGVELAVAHLIIGLFFCITIVGIPFGKQHFKLAQVALMPFGTYTF